MNYLAILKSLFKNTKIYLLVMIIVLIWIFTFNDLIEWVALFPALLYRSVEGPC